MSVTSPNSESFELISTSDANESINSVSQLSQTSFNCCPNCSSADLHFRRRYQNYVCRRCGHIFLTPAILATRSRKCCPECETVNIYRRITKKDYLCLQCGNTFNVPATKTVRVGGPNQGRKLVANKKAEAV